MVFYLQIMRNHKFNHWSILIIEINWLDIDFYIFILKKYIKLYFS